MTPPYKWKSVKWLRKSFEDKFGKPDPRAFTVFLSFIYIVQSGVGDQYWGKRPTIEIFDAFWWIVVIGIGLLSPELLSKVPFLNKGKTDDKANTKTAALDNSGGAPDNSQ
jgi:hypothetical protein